MKRIGNAGIVTILLACCLLLSACGGGGSSTSKHMFYKDADGDGYSDGTTEKSSKAPTGFYRESELTAISGDCNDANGAVNPGATEVCNLIDDDCDGSTDEGVTTTYYLDGDNDDYGLLGSTTEACSLPTGYADNSTDCDDSDINVNPGAAEVCNLIDDDCDGSTDEGVTTTYYLDGDGDNYGLLGATTEACSLPTGYADNSRLRHQREPRSRRSVQPHR